LRFIVLDPGSFIKSI